MSKYVLTARTEEEVRAIPNHEIDRALEAGLKCPHCGESKFNTLQQGVNSMTCTNGEWGDQGEWGGGDTIEVSCDECGDLVIWEAHDTHKETSK